VRAFAAICVLAFCGVGLAVLLMYILTGNHGASFRSEGFVLPFLAWGGASAVGVLRQRVWGRWSFLAWVVVTSLALCAAGVSGTFAWPEASRHPGHEESRTKKSPLYIREFPGTLFLP